MWAPDLKTRLFHVLKHQQKKLINKTTNMLTLIQDNEGKQNHIYIYITLLSQYITEFPIDISFYLSDNTLNIFL